MANLFSLLVGGDDSDPIKRQAMNQALSTNGGLWAKLGAYRAAIDGAPMMAERQQILREAYTPEQKATRDLVTAPAFRVAQDKPATFDLETAQRRLVAMGDIGTAESLAKFQEAQRRAATGGGDEAYFSPQFGFDQSGNLVPIQFSNRGNAKRGSLPEGVTGLAFPNEYKDTGGAIVALPKYGAGGPRPVATKTLTPDAALSNSPEVQARIAEAKAAGAAIGQGQGESVVKANKLVANAGDILAVLDEAEPLIRQSTGSGVGRVVDAIAGGVGISTAGAEAGDQLTILGNKLTMMVPRFEGPQSNIDVKSYEKAAGDLANTAIPRPRRLAALQIIRRLNQKYASPPSPYKPGQAPAPNQPRKLSAREQMNAIQQAKDAAAAGKDKAAINKRLRELGVNFQVK